jgi:Ni,Fe-hydrogenase III small subunit/ferredoxin
VIRWFLRGVAHRRLTTRYPRQPEHAPPAFRSRALLDPDAPDSGGEAWRLAEVCLPGALSLDGSGRLRLDASRCIGCGLCVEAAQNGSLTIDNGYELATTRRERLVVERDGAEPDMPAGGLGGPFRRSLHIRHIDTGSDGAVEQEIAALLNPYYDMHRLGLFFTATPRHADVLLVTGPVTGPTREPLRRTWEVMPEPKAVVAVGTDACAGGLHPPDGVTAGGVDHVLPVDVYVPGSPPAPTAIMHALLLAIGLLTGDEVAA